MGITNTDDVIDSRDVISRIEELESEREDLASEVKDALAARDEAETAADMDGEDESSRETFGEAVDALRSAESDLETWDEEKGEELTALKSLASEAEGCSDWVHGATLIHDAYFPTYAEDLVSDIGDLPCDLPGYIVIDWEATANNIQQDYMSVDFDGQTYWVRA